MTVCPVALAARTNPVPGDYSEQQMVDCARGQNGANGCDPSRYDSYLKYAKGQANTGFAAEVKKTQMKTETLQQVSGLIPLQERRSEVFKQAGLQERGQGRDA